MGTESSAAFWEAEASDCHAGEGARATLCLEFAREDGYGSLIGDFTWFC